MGTTFKVPARSSGDGQQYELPPADNHAAVCVAIVDLGHQLRRKYQSQEQEYQPLVYFCWELVDLPSRPLIGREFKVSMHEKAGLRHFVEQWSGKVQDGEDFDLFSLKGKPCFLNVIHEKKGEKTYARIESATPPPKVKNKRVEVEAPEHEPFTWAPDDGKLSDIPDWLPWLYGREIADWIKDSKERGVQGNGATADQATTGEQAQDVF